MSDTCAWNFVNVPFLTIKILMTLTNGKWHHFLAVVVEAWWRLTKPAPLVVSRAISSLSHCVPFSQCTLKDSHKNVLWARIQFIHWCDVALTKSALWEKISHISLVAGTIVSVISQVPQSVFLEMWPDINFQTVCLCSNYEYGHHT